MSAPIVLIDDEPALCRVYGLALQRLGRAVFTFTDPQEAVTHLSVSERPCVVVCDFRMPGLTGLEVLSQLPAGVPFVLVSGDATAADAAASASGVHALLVKPLRPEELLSTVLPFVEATASSA